MTDDRMALLSMAEKAGEVDFLRELVREVVQELMEAEVDRACVGLSAMSAVPSVRTRVMATASGVGTRAWA